MRRRVVLAATGTVGIGSIAGCMNSFAEDGLWIGRVLVETTGACRLHVELERDDEEILSRRFTFDGNEGTWIEATWNSSPATYTVRYVGLDFDNIEGIVTHTLTRETLNESRFSPRGDLRDEDCVVLVVRATPSRSELGFSLYPPGYFERECPTG